MAYEVRVVAMDGTNLGTLDNAKVGSYSHELNAAGAADITLATTDPDAVLVQPGREVQIWQDGTIQWWGPIIRPQARLKESVWQCAELLWYFGRRFLGRSDRTNLLTNGNFEAGEASWTFAGGVTHSLDPAIKVEGTQSLELSGATANHIQYATQTMAPHVQGHPYGDALTASTWVWVASAGYLGGAVQDLGLVAIHRNAAGATLNAEYVEIGDDTEKDAWIPLEVLIPAVKEDDTVEVRLFPPHGTAYFDLVTLTAMESLAFWPTADVADIVEGLVLYAQDQFPGISHGKSDLNITVSAPNTGTTTSRAYQFAEHRNILDAIAEFVRQGVLDVDIVITPTTRVFTTYAPTKGSLYGTTLTLGTAAVPGNLAGFSWSWDGETAATSVVVLGPGDGPDRPEGSANDAAALGGLTLEVVESAPDHVTVGELDDQAAERLTALSDPEILEVTTMPAAIPVGAINVGDTATVVIAYGWVNINAVYRVVRISVDPNTDQQTLTLNVTS